MWTTSRVMELCLNFLYLLKNCLIVVGHVNVAVVVVFFSQNINPNCNFPHHHVTLSVEQHNSTTPPSCVLMLDRNASAAHCEWWR